MNWESQKLCPTPCPVWHDVERESPPAVFQRTVLSGNIKAFPSFLLPQFRIHLCQCIWQNSFEQCMVHALPSAFVILTFLILGMYSLMLKMMYRFSVEELQKHFLEWYFGFPGCTSGVHTSPISEKQSAKFVEFDGPVVGLVHYLSVCLTTDLNIIGLFKRRAGSLWLSPTGKECLPSSMDTAWKHTEPPSFNIRLYQQWV